MSLKNVTHAKDRPTGGCRNPKMEIRDGHDGCGRGVKEIMSRRAISRAGRL